MAAERKPIPLSAAIGIATGYAGVAGIVGALAGVSLPMGTLAALVFVLVIVLGVSYKLFAQIVTPLGDTPPPLANCILLAVAVSLVTVVVRTIVKQAGWPRSAGSGAILVVSVCLARPFLRLSGGRCLGVALVGALIAGISLLAFARFTGVAP